MWPGDIEITQTRSSRGRPATRLWFLWLLKVEAEEEPRAAAAGGAESSAGAEVDVDAGVVIGGGIGVGVDVAVRSPQSEKTPISAPSSATSEEPPECGCPHSA